MENQTLIVYNSKKSFINKYRYVLMFLLSIIFLISCYFILTIILYSFGNIEYARFFCIALFQHKQCQSYWYIFSTFWVILTISCIILILGLLIMVFIMLFPIVFIYTSGILFGYIYYRFSGRKLFCCNYILYYKSEYTEI